MPIFYIRALLYQSKLYTNNRVIEAKDFDEASAKATELWPRASVLCCAEKTETPCKSVSNTT